MEEVEIYSSMVLEEMVMVVVGTCNNKEEMATVMEVVESCKRMEQAVIYNSNLEVVMEKVVVKTYHNQKVQVQVQPMTEEILYHQDMVPMNNDMEMEPILKVRMVNYYRMEMVIVAI